MDRLIARLALVLPLLPAVVAADVVRLKSGGEVRGVIVAPSDGTTGTVTVETLSGGVVSVPREDVEFVTRRPRVVEEYELKAKTAPETIPLFRIGSVNTCCASSRSSRTTVRPGPRSARFSTTASG